MIHRCRRPLTLLVAVAALMAAPAVAGAQGGATLTGSVHDQTGAPLAAVRVALRGAADRRESTGPGGDFTFRDLPRGTYEVSVELAGFERQTRAVRLRAGEHAVLAFTLLVAFVEETIVTAAKAGERAAQRMPMAISAIPDGDLERLGTHHLGEGAALGPSVTLSQNTGSGQLSIRGIGTNVVFAGADPGSAMYQDGVYLARPAMAFIQFLDLDRIEVLRGPQGTLYGRNAVGGALNLISKRPTNDARASATITAGDRSALRGAARLSGPIKRDRVLGSVAFVRGVQDGYVRDLDHPDHPLGADDVLAARGQLHVIFDRRFDLLLSSDVDIQRGTPLTFSKVLAAKPGVQIDNPPDLHDVRASALAWNRTRHSGANARLTAALTPATTVVSLTGYRSFDYEFFVDADVTELSLVTTHQHERQHQLSQEITVSYERPRLAWVGGVFLFDEIDRQSFWVDQPAAGVQVRLAPRVEASSRAVFGQATVGLTSRVSATAGLRYTHERKDIDNSGGRYGLEAPSPPVPGSTYDYLDSIAYAAWTPKVGVEVKLDARALAYVSATRGFKTGGFNPSSPVPAGGYAPEWAWSYEAGWKATLADGRSRIGLSGFVMDYTDLQVQTPIGIGVFDIRNAAAATLRGIELENTSHLGGGFTAGGHLTWLDTSYGRYVAVANDGSIADVAGNRLTNAPVWAGRLWVEWARGFGRSRRLSAALDATAQSTVFYTPFNDGIQRQDPYGLLGARVEYGRDNGRWSVAAYARNLTNSDYITASFGTSPAAFGGRPGPQRQLAVDFTIRR